MDRWFKRIVFFFFILSNFLSLQYARADGYLPLPGVSLSGTFINNNSGWADAMVPVYGDSSMIYYLDPQGVYSGNNQFTTSLGTGFRLLTQQAGILGFYLFGDYNHSENNNSFWFISPGIERLGEILDFSANLYIPVSTQRIDTRTAFASQMGDSEFVEFSGHDEFDQMITYFESTGIGLDAEIGYRLPFLHNNTKLYVGGYYYAPKDTNSIIGESARLEVPVTDYLNLSVSDAYDNVFNNTVKAGITISLFGRSNHVHDYDVESRLVDPIQRNRIAVEGSSPTSQYIAEGQKAGGEELLFADNVWFFSANGAVVASPTINNCTSETPCSNQNINSSFFNSINDIALNAKMYLAPGTYDNINSSLNLLNGQSIWGRTTDFKQSASASDRPLLIGSLDLFGNNNLNSLRLANNPSNTQLQGILIEDGAGNNFINNILIGNTGSDATGAYSIGIQANNNTSFTIFSSEIDTFNASRPVTSINVIGSNNTVSIENSILNANGVTHSTAIFGAGSNNNWSIFNNQINSTDSSGTAEGIEEQGGNSNSWEIMDNKITTTATSTSTDISVANASKDLWTIRDNQLESSSSNGSAIGISSSMGSNNNWDLSANNIQINTGGDHSGGIVVSGGTQEIWNLQDNNIKLNLSKTNASATVFGIYANSNVDSQWILDSNFISLDINGDFTTAIGIEDNLGQGNVWDLNQNKITTKISGDSVNAFGFYFNSSNNSGYHLNNNIINSTVTGNNSDAFGGYIAGHNNKINSTGDIITVNATGENTKAYGFAANMPSLDQGSANLINLSDDNISISAESNADGIYDPWDIDNTNAWNYLSLQNSIKTTSSGQACTSYLESNLPGPECMP